MKSRDKLHGVWGILYKPDMCIHKDYFWESRNTTAVRDNDNLKSYKYVCITTYQPDTKSIPNPNPNPNPTTKQHAIVNIELNIVTCSAYPDKFIRDNVVAPSVPTSVVIVTLPYDRLYYCEAASMLNDRYQSGEQCYLNGQK